MKRYRWLKKFWLLFIIIVLISVTIFAKDNRSSIGQEDLIYYLLTDRFYDGDPANNQNARKKDFNTYHGGDFQGIIDKLDYIKDLGFTTIWISPVVANLIRGYHGYWPTDFYQTNENFGSLEKLKELVAKAHEKGIKVIVDLVVTHTSRSHPWFSDPKYYDWFHHRGPIQNWNDQQELEEGELANLPHLNHSNPEVKKYLIDMAKWWIRETGIDGYRLDTARHVPKIFWKEFAAEIEKEFPGFYLIGEIFDGRADYVGGYQQAGLDGLEDYPLHFAIADVFAGNKPANRLIEMVNQCKANYPNVYLMGTIIDTHDVPRFMSQAYGEFAGERLKQALTFLMTYTGIPIMYYGTEVGLEGSDDPHNRRDMDWEVKSPLTDYVKALTAIRKANKALMYGDFQLINVEDDLLMFSRRFEENIIIVVFNLSDQKKLVKLALPGELCGVKSILIDLIGSKNLKLKQGKFKLAMEPHQVNIFRLSSH